MGDTHIHVNRDHPCSWELLLSRLFSAKVWNGIFECMYLLPLYDFAIVNTISKVILNLKPYHPDSSFLPSCSEGPPPHFGKRLKFHEDFHFFIYHHRSEVLLHIHTHTKNEIKKWNSLSRQKQATFYLENSLLRWERLDCHIKEKDLLPNLVGLYPSSFVIINRYLPSFNCWI